MIEIFAHSPTKLSPCLSNIIFEFHHNLSTITYRNTREKLWFLEYAICIILVRPRYFLKNKLIRYIYAKSARALYLRSERPTFSFDVFYGRIFSLCHISAMSNKLRAQRPLFALFFFVPRSFSFYCVLFVLPQRRQLIKSLAAMADQLIRLFTIRQSATLATTT